MKKFKLFFLGTGSCREEGVKLTGPLTRHKTKRTRNADFCERRYNRYYSESFELNHKKDNFVENFKPNLLMLFI